MTDVDELTKVLIDSKATHLPNRLAAKILASPWGQRVQALEAALEEWKVEAKRAADAAQAGTDLAVEYHTERDRLRDLVQEALEAIEETYEPLSERPELVQRLRAALDHKEVAP